jgi:hypothetical protein
MSPICVKYRSESSRGGFSLDELKSGLQKYIRRGMLNEAAYCLNEFLSFRDIHNYSEHERDVKRIFTNLYHRLLIISMEDIGPNIAGCIRELNDSFLQFRKNFHFDVGMQILVTLCRMYKSRECSWYKYYWYGQSISIDVYEPAYEKFFTCETPQVQTMCNELICSLKNKEDRAVYFAFDIATVEKTEGSYLRAKDPHRLIFHILKTYAGIDIEPWFTIYATELKNCAEKFLCWLTPMIAFLKGKTNSERAFVDPEAAMKFVMGTEKMVLHDFVYDKHTKKGKSHPVRKTSEYFWQESSKVYPECPTINKLYKDIYCRVKKESDLVDFKIRAQLLCGNGKTDTYFGVLKTDLEKFSQGETVFVKGPFEEESSVDNALFCNELKAKWKLPYVKMQKVKLVPDIFPEAEVVFGCRKTCKSGWFLICENLKDFDVKNPPFEIKNSKNYKDTVVLKSESLIISEDNIHGEIGFQYVVSLLFRYYVGIPDVANRNFLIKQGKVYSVDEDIIKREVKFNMSKGIKEKISEVCEEYEGEIVKMLEEWNRTEKIFHVVEADIEEVRKILG